MRNHWYKYTDAGKFMFFSGILIVGSQLYECLSRGLPENVDELLSFVLYLAVGLAAVYYGLKQKISETGFESHRNQQQEKYEVIKTSQYGTRTYGPYDTYAEAKIAVEKFEGNLFDESFYEIKVVSAAKYDGDH